MLFFFFIRWRKERERSEMVEVVDWSFTNITYLLSYFRILIVIKLCYLTYLLYNSVQIIINGEEEEELKNIPLIQIFMNIFS